VNAKARTGLACSPMEPDRWAGQARLGWHEPVDDPVAGGEMERSILVEQSVLGDGLKAGG